jgi:hypothetical protein
MENRDNVTAIGQVAADLGRIFWSFQYPHQVVSDRNLSLEEKRAILAAWASDVHAVESFPTLRHLPGTPFPVAFSSIIDARLHLDGFFSSENDDPVPPSPGHGPHCHSHFRVKEAA